MNVSTKLFDYTLPRSIMTTNTRDLTKLAKPTQIVARFSAKFSLTLRSNLVVVNGCEGLNKSKKIYLRNQNSLFHGESLVKIKPCQLWVAFSWNNGRG